jgi:hypothetical protein
MATTFRSDIAGGLHTILLAFVAANPTLLRRAFRARPASWTTDLPAAWVEVRNEAITHDAGVRTRTMQPTVLVVDRLTDNTETMDRMDDLVDALLDHFTANPHITPNTVWDQLAISDETEQLTDGSWVSAVRFTFGNVSAREGRD